jgi:hypothetical protein
MSVPVVHGNNALEAWLAGAALIIRDRELKNLITTIESPCEFAPLWFIQMSPHRLFQGCDNISDVVNTVFPERLRERHETRDTFYASYLARHDRARRITRSRAWGTYFERLIRFPQSGVNQLEKAIEKLRTWPQRNTTGLVFHLSSPAIDSPRTRGGPCWQFGELLWNIDGTIDLVVVYRNHDFFNKVLGNFIGLGYLLRFICTQSGKQPGRLVCHSCHAFSSAPMTNLRRLTLLNNE